jgi:MoxR-like ATPase
LQTIRDELSVEYLERRNTLEFMLLTLLSKQHGYMLGAPGVAKSALIRAVVARILDLPLYFETSMSKTRDPSTVLGPIDLPRLRDTGDLVRRTSGYIQDAVIAMIDEIGKMGPTMGHDLLSILLERLFHEVGNGHSARKVPLYTCFTASNELIVGESDDAKALWDRLLMRTVVEDIQEAGNFAVLVRQGARGPLWTPEVTTTVNWPDLADVIDNVVPAIPVPEPVVETMVRLRDTLRADGLTVSARRFKQSVRVLQASAFLDGRTEVQEDDINALRYTLWDVPEQIPQIERICLTVSNPMAEKVLALLDASDEILAGVESRKGQALETRARYGSEAHGKVKILMSELGQLRQDALTAGRGTTKLDEAAGKLAEVRRRIYVECLDMESPEVPS